MSVAAYIGARIFDGDGWHDNAALIVENDRIAGIAAVPRGADVVDLAGGLLAPGFIDLQVNGGGGVQFNDEPTEAGLAAICAAHAGLGTTGVLVTLITDAPDVTDLAIAAAAAARDRMPGFLGLHLEGPHLSPSRRGAHEAAMIRPMEPPDLARLRAAAACLPRVVVTVAPDIVPPVQIADLVAAGCVISLGHSDATAADVSAAADAGATMVTHLFNAMSQLGSREPGMVGAVLNDARLHAGLIADGIHVAPDTIRLALRAKAGPGRIFLVSDAMSPAGTARGTFTLNGRTIRRADGALRLADGTLAGADLTMATAVAFMHTTVGVSLEEALRMGALYPAEAARLAGRGHLRPGALADFVHLDGQLGVRGAWIGGNRVRSGP